MIFGIVAAIAAPASLLLPSKRRIISMSILFSLIASLIPLATSSQRVMPPKTLIKIAPTLSYSLTMRTASFTRSAAAPPPRSNAKQTLKPLLETRSMVFINIPDPLQITATVPSGSQGTQKKLFFFASSTIASPGISTLKAAKFSWILTALSSMLILPSKAQRLPLLSITNGLISVSVQWLSIKHLYKLRTNFCICLALSPLKPAWSAKYCPV